jgi:hypothetical protein
MKSRVKHDFKVDPAWRQAAGPKLTASAFHFATVSDGPEGRWEEGRYYRIEAKNRAALTRGKPAEIEDTEEAEVAS